MTPLRKVLWLGVLGSMLISSFTAGFAAVEVEILRNDVEVTYPDKAVFKLEFDSDIEISEIELSFGTDALSCAKSITRAFPEDYEPVASGETEWEWNFRHSGTIPPGTEVWWEWTLTDSNGEEFTTERRTFVYWDDNQDWKRAEGEHVILYWLEGNDSFAQSLIDAGDGLANQFETEVGVELSEKVTVLVYPDGETMQEATLFLPAWSGGVAFTEYHKVLVGIAPGDLGWGGRVMRHEMTHVIALQYTFSCVDSSPVWFTEGIAEYFEGPWQNDSKRRLENAIEGDAIFSVIELGYGFSGDPELARLAYSQSHSLVEYLLETYGQGKMLALLDQYKEGTPEDKALQAVYGFDRNGLEAEWRIAAGATPLELGPEASPTPTRTPVPTMAPIGGPVSSGPSSTPEPSAVPTEIAEVAATEVLSEEDNEVEENNDNDNNDNDAEQNENNADNDENADSPFFSQICGAGFLALFSVVGLVVQRRKREFN